MTVCFEEDPPKVTPRVFCRLKGTSIPPEMNPQLDHLVRSETKRKFRPKVPLHQRLVARCCLLLACSRRDTARLILTFMEVKWELCPY